MVELTQCVSFEVFRFNQATSVLIEIFFQYGRAQSISRKCKGRDQDSCKSDSFLLPTAKSRGSSLGSIAHPVLQSSHTSSAFNQDNAPQLLTYCVMFTANPTIWTNRKLGCHSLGRPQSPCSSLLRGWSSEVTHSLN